MERNKYNWIPRLVLIFVILFCIISFVYAESFQTSLTIIEVISPQPGECIKGVCAELINDTLRVWW